jgi:hypothetical protein
MLRIEVRNVLGVSKSCFDIFDIFYDMLLSENQNKENNMKKIAFLSIGLSALLFTGCGGGSSSSSTPATPSTQQPTPTTNNSSACTIDGNTVLVDEGTTCTDQGHTLKCENSRVTYDSSISGATVNINGRTYTCQ